MFLKHSFADEVARNMDEYLNREAADKAVAREEKLVKAADLLNAASEILDELGLYAEAEQATRLLELSVKTADVTQHVRESHPTGVKNEHTLSDGQKVVEHPDSELDNHLVDDNMAMSPDLFDDEMDGDADFESYEDDDDSLSSNPDLRSIIRELHQANKRDSVKDDFEDEDLDSELYPEEEF